MVFELPPPGKNGCTEEKEEEEGADHPPWRMADNDDKEWRAPVMTPNARVI